MDMSQTSLCRFNDLSTDSISVMSRAAPRRSAAYFSLQTRLRGGFLYVLCFGRCATDVTRIPIARWGVGFESGPLQDSAAIELAFFVVILGSRHPATSLK